MSKIPLSFPAQSDVFPRVISFTSSGKTRSCDVVGTRQTIVGGCRCSGKRTQGKIRLDSAVYV